MYFLIHHEIYENELLAVRLLICIKRTLASILTILWLGEEKTRAVDVYFLRAISGNQLRIGELRNWCSIYSHSNIQQTKQNMVRLPLWINIESIPKQRLHLVCNLTGIQTHSQSSCTRWTVGGTRNNEQQWLLALCSAASDHLIILLDNTIQTSVTFLSFFEWKMDFLWNLS